MTPFITGLQEKGGRKGGGEAEEEKEKKSCVKLAHESKLEKSKFGSSFVIPSNNKRLNFIQFFSQNIASLLPFHFFMKIARVKS